MTQLDHPDTAAAHAAVELANDYYPPALFNHCLRSYHFAADAGRRLNLDVDDEMLLVAAVLHDVGLLAMFDSATVPFEVAGGHVAEVFTRGAGWNRTRQRRTREVIIQHMGAGVAPDVDPEGHLLDIATGLDISGRNVGQWDHETLKSVVAAYPRLDLTDVFSTCFANQERRKPGSAAGHASRSGIRRRLELNPLNDI